MIEPRFHYATFTEAITALRKKGFTIDFNLKEHSIVSHGKQLAKHEFYIAEVYRYEGNTDPADEANVYAIISNSGLKWILVTGYDGDVDTETTELLTQLHY